jgi:hypothetical protein
MNVADHSHTGFATMVKDMTTKKYIMRGIDKCHIMQIRLLSKKDRFL